MVIDFINSREQINQRAMVVGEWLRKNKHHAADTLVVPSVKCGIHALNHTGVSIVLGYSSDGPIVVGIPLAVFEHADAAIFKEWVDEENAAKYHQTAEAIRNRELKLLDSLLMKYPEEATTILDEMPTEEDLNGIQPV